jgi:putative addiction module killer protein
MVDVREYLDRSGDSYHAGWAGQFFQCESVGSGVHECRIALGPGYRVYFGKDGERLVILLGEGTKKRQQTDIKDAIARWQHYKNRKK